MSDYEPFTAKFDFLKARGWAMEVLYNGLSNSISWTHPDHESPKRRGRKPGYSTEQAMAIEAAKVEK